MPLVSEARVGFLMNEPTSDWKNTIDRAGHIGIYFSDICADGALKVRACLPGEPGSILQRQESISAANYGWIVTPAPLIMAGTLNPLDAPLITTESLRRSMQVSAYNEFYHTSIAPEAGKEIPDGGWSHSYSGNNHRNQYLITIDSTQADDQAVINAINSAPNIANYNLFWRNCATEVKEFMNMMLPSGEKIKNGVSTMGWPSPIGMAKGLIDLGRKHPELELTISKIRQTPSLFPRSKPFLFPLQNMYRNKLFLALLPLWHPYMEIAGAVFIYYELIHPFRLRKQADILASGAPAETEQAIDQKVELITQIKKEIDEEKNDSPEASELRNLLAGVKANLHDLREQAPMIAKKALGDEDVWQNYREMMLSKVQLLLEHGHLPIEAATLISQGKKVGKFYPPILRFLETQGHFTGDIHSGGMLELTFSDDLIPRKTSLSLTAIGSGDPVLAELVLIAALDYDLDPKSKNYPELHQFQEMWNTFEQLEPQ